MNTDLVSYYRDRAAEYEKVYDKPERQAGLLQVERLLQAVVRDKNVFEIACGTGYWTQKIAATAESVFATDINSAVLEIARSKEYARQNVAFAAADVFRLGDYGAHEALFGGFIWSHIGLPELPRFLDGVDSAVRAGGTVVFVDNQYAEGSSLPVSGRDEWGNTYQTRTLEDGTQHKVMKNFPAADFLREMVAGRGFGIKVFTFQYYWVLVYRTCEAPVAKTSGT